MDQKTPTSELPDEALLQALTARERNLVESTMNQHPLLTVAEAIEALREAGM